jgi:tetratricopeptide (TPR) repeat protein
MSQEPLYDVFFSYARADAGAPLLAQALARQGLRVCRDEEAVSTVESITGRLVEGLSRSTALVAYYSTTYLRRRACQWELTAAFLAQQRAGGVPQRMVLVNPETGTDHIQPGVLRDLRFHAAPDPTDELGNARLAAEISSYVRSLGGVLGDNLLVSPPRWLPSSSRRVGSPRFVGRLAQLLELHSALHASDHPLTSGRVASDIALVRGLAGQGKSLLTEEYALRFGAAYPGGIFWLTAGGDIAGAAPGPDQLEAEQIRQLRSIAGELGLSVDGLGLCEIRGIISGYIERRGHSCLWVVDGLPSQLQRDELRKWVSPHPLGRTLLTSRGRHDVEATQTVLLEELGLEDAYELLTARSSPPPGNEEAAAWRIIEDLGRHALAIDVAGAALTAQAGMMTFAEFRDRLVHPGDDELEFASQLADDIPRDAGTSIATALLASLQQLDEEGRDLLRVAACLAAEPIAATLILKVFRHADGIGDDVARHRVALATRQALALSLADRLDDGMRVHRLVSRTMNFHEQHKARHGQLRGSAIAVLTEELARIVDPRVHVELSKLVVHARALVEQLNEVEEMALLLWVARYDYTTGAFGSAEALGRALVEARCGLLGPDHSDTLTAMNNLADTLRTVGELGQAQDLQEAVLAVRRREHGEDHPPTMAAMNNLAATLLVRRELGRAQNLQETVLIGYRHVLGEDHPDTLTAMNNLAETLRTRGELARAQELQEMVLARRRHVLGEDHPDTLIAMNNVAETVCAAGNLQRAQKLQETVLTGLQQVLGKEHPHSLMAMNNLARTLQALGELVQARNLQETVLTGLKRVLGQDHPDTLTAMNNLAETLRALGELVEARNLQETVLTGLKRVLGEHHTDTLMAMNNLAETLRAAEELGSAQVLQETALTELQRALGDDHPNVLKVMNNLAVTLQALGEVARARELQETVLAGLRRALGEHHLDTLMAMNNLAATERTLCKLWQAKDLQETVLIGRRRALGEHRPDTLVAMSNLASTLRALGELGRAQEFQEIVLAERRRALGDDHHLTHAAMDSLALTRRACEELEP